MAPSSRPDLTAPKGLYNRLWSQLTSVRPRRWDNSLARSTSNPVSFPASICSNGTKPGLIATRRVPEPEDAEPVDVVPHPASATNESPINDAQTVLRNISDVPSFTPWETVRPGSACNSAPC